MWCLGSGRSRTCASGSARAPTARLLLAADAAADAVALGARWHESRPGPPGRRTLSGPPGDSRRERLILSSTAFFAAFGTARVVAQAIRRGIGPFRNLGTAASTSITWSSGSPAYSPAATSGSTSRTSTWSCSAPCSRSASGAAHFPGTSPGRAAGLASSGSAGRRSSGPAGRAAEHGYRHRDRLVDAQPRLAERAPSIEIGCQPDRQPEVL